MRYSDLIPPFWVREIRKLVRLDPQILDFGCANESARTTKRWFPRCSYHGADITQKSNSEYIDVFYRLSENDSLVGIPNAEFDVVLMKHVIEHLPEPLETLKALVCKLKAGGVIFVSFPHPRSANLPRAEGTLNFYDDPTHIWLPSIDAVARTLVASGVEILRCGTTRSPDKVALGIPMFGANLVRNWIGRPLQAKGLWDLYGFEYHFLGRNQGSRV